MRVVDAAERPPRKCAVTGREQGPFVDFLTQIDPGSPAIPNNLYLRAAVVEEAAKQLGMVPKSEVDTLADQLAKVTADLDDLRGVHELSTELETLTSKINERSAA